MTTVYERAPAGGPGGPGIHVLVIGVGKYPHLIEGGELLAGKPLGLSQLSSPPVSAKAFIDWCLAPLRDPGAVGLANPGCPLASVEALVSGQVPVMVQAPAGPKQLEAATRKNIQAAFKLWLGHLTSNDANIGVFYFCGHGIMVADQYLLAEDFGRDRDLPWNEAFDISNTLRAVEREVRGALYFFIDACREITREVALTLGANPLSLKVVDLSKPVIRASTSLLQATGEGKLAFGLGGRVSRFTDALLTALSGYCGVKGPGPATWDVDGETLASAVRKLLESGNKTPERRQVTDQAIGGTSVPLLRLAAAPRVKVELDLLPDQMRKLAKLYLESARGARFEQDGEKGAFMLEVPRGVYSVGARAAANQFRELLYENENLDPPLYGLIMQAVP
jgi:hypothetical protein